MKRLAKLAQRVMIWIAIGWTYSKCPVCGYYAFNGEECFDCGYRPS